MMRSIESFPRRIAVTWLLGCSVLFAHGPVAADPADSAAIARGWDVLVNQPLLPSDFSQTVVDQLWRSWPEPLRSQAAQASPAQRRRMTMTRYGLTPRPTLSVEIDAAGDCVSRFTPPGDALTRNGPPSLDRKSIGVDEDADVDPGKPMQYVVDDQNNWTMNCLSCHGGTVYGVPTPGAPNNRYALQTLTEEVRSTKFRIGEPLGRMELGSLFIPLGTTHGTTNAVVFGMGLMQFRDAELNVIDKAPAPLTHHDMDAPPWWHFHKRPHLYIDGFAEKGHRGLMQFTLVPENKASFYREREDDFRDVFAFLSSLRPPKFSGDVDEDLADRGQRVFEQNCSRCHGTYGDDPSYPDLTVDIGDIGTDPVRWEALPVSGREKYAQSWFAHGGEADEQSTRVAPSGYVAPPLDGVWASPPYFHNGSVPTLWHVLHPDERPTVWRPIAVEMDADKIGLQVESVDRVPLQDPDVAARRTYFDTRRFGKSNVGHDYPSELTAEERTAVLEYLKTL